MKMASRLTYLKTPGFLLFLLFPFLALSQETTIPDSMSSYVSSIKEILDTKDTIPNGSLALLRFLAPLESKKLSSNSRTLNYLAYGFKGYQYYLSGKYDNALLAYNNAHTFLSETEPYDPLLGHYYFLRAESLLESGDQERGIQFLKDAEEVFLENKNLTFLSQIYQKQSDFYFQNNKPAQALEALDNIISFYQKEKNTPTDVLIKKGRLLSVLSRFKEADRYFNLAKNNIDKSNNLLSGELNAAIGTHLLRQGKPTEALALYNYALEKLCPGIRETKFAAFKNCTDPNAFLSALRFRGSILKQIRDEETTEKGQKNIYNNYLTGIRYLQFLQNNATENKNYENFSEERDYFLEEGITAAHSLFQSTDNSKYVEYALDFANIRKHPGSQTEAEATDFQKFAKDQHKDFVYFFYGSRQVFIFVITDQGHQFHRIQKATDFDIKLLQLIDSHQLPFLSNREFQNFKTLSHEIYSLLFENLQLTKKKLVVVPDGLLSFLSFDSFVTALESKVSYPLDYLLFHKEITYAYSLPHLKKAIATEPLHTRTVLAIAPKDFKRHGLIPLKGTPGHIRFLEDKLQARKWINQEASVDNFETLIPQNEFNIISFLTHASSEEEPWFCFYDKKLPLSKLPALKANIATLNACNTIVRKNQKNSILNLSHTLCERGIATSIAPLWNVQHPKTVKLLEFFYLNLASGMEKDEAIQKAKISYLKSCGNDAVAASPHFWAGTALTGNTESLYSTSFLFPIIFVILFALMIFAWKRTQQEVG